MIGGMITLASYGFFGGSTIGNFLSNLEALGFFNYVLPFLMIFAIVYAILSRSHLIGDKDAINIILSLAVSFMALQFNFVPYFFSEIFPRMGVLLSIILVAIILLSLFWDFKGKNGGIAKAIVGILVGIGFVLILVQSFGEAFGFSLSSGFPFGGTLGWQIQRNLPLIFMLAFVVVGIGALIAKGRREDNNQNTRHLP